MTHEACVAGSLFGEMEKRCKNTCFCPISLTALLLMPLYSFTRILHETSRGVARGVLGCPWPPLGRPSFEQTTYNIQVAKTTWQYLGCKSHCWKAHFFKIVFFVKYFRQRLLSLVNMGLHAAIMRLSPLIHEGEQQYKPYIVGDPRMVSLLNITLWPPLWKILATPLTMWLTVCGMPRLTEGASFHQGFWGQ